MVTMAMAMANRKGTTNSKMVRNQHAGGATSMDIVRKTVANESRQTLHAKASPVGEEEEQQEIQGAVGKMYTGQLATVFSGFH